ncbi:MAG TPA: alpha/beta hydrolase, partial [Tianweitania sediminis]|nr:alpha/beta hydrolase [Tianweitania sediminis]
HPWPGAATSWYNKVTSVPLLGFLFAELFALPGGLTRLPQAVACVFAPNALPADYSDQAGIPLILRPGSFRANAEDVEGLYRHVSAIAPNYPTITAPTVVITGNRDTVVYEEIHSEGLARDIPGAELVWVDNLGHKPDWVAPDLVLAAVVKVAGNNAIDLQAAVRVVEARIAGDQHNVGRCPEPAGATQSEPLAQ